MRRYSGYTLQTLADGDIAELFQHFALLDPDIGKAKPIGDE